MLAVEAEIPYSEIPGWPRCSALGHRGRLLAGELRSAGGASLPAILLDGRFHLYEGRSPEEVVRPIRLVHALGVELAVLLNASGGVNPRLASGDVVVVDDHVNLLFRTPHLPPEQFAEGRPLAPPGPLYDPELIALALDLAGRGGHRALAGCYAALLGPNYETRAEYRAVRRLGADVVGMSTVCELATAASLGLRTLVLSAVANVARPDCLEPTTGEHVCHLASRAVPCIRAILSGLVERLA
jgi:purine-nucleoside phosphorylase